jgi:hypothetical protein
MSDPYLKDVVISPVDSVEIACLRRSADPAGWALTVDGRSLDMDFVGTRLIVATGGHRKSRVGRAVPTG